MRACRGPVSLVSSSASGSRGSVRAAGTLGIAHGVAPEALGCREEVAAGIAEQVDPGIGSRSARSLDEQSLPRGDRVSPEDSGARGPIENPPSSVRFRPEPLRLDPCDSWFSPGFARGLRFWGLLRLNLMLVAGVLAGFAAFSPAT